MLKDLQRLAVRLMAQLQHDLLNCQLGNERRLLMPKPDFAVLTDLLLMLLLAAQEQSCSLLPALLENLLLLAVEPLLLTAQMLPPVLMLPAVGFLQAGMLLS